jgi:CheY-like chemotaxis protein
VEDWHVLVVEDDIYSAEVLLHMFRFHKIAADVAMTGEQALVMLDAHQYTAAVIDLSLPGMTGWELVQVIHENPETVTLPCVAVTAYFDSHVEHEARRFGFVAAFPKPLFTSFIEELKRTVIKSQ